MGANQITEMIHARFRDRLQNITRRRALLSMNENPYKSPESWQSARVADPERPILSFKRIFSSFALVALSGLCAERCFDCLVILLFRQPDVELFLYYLAFDVAVGALCLVAAAAIIRAPFRSSK